MKRKKNLNVVGHKAYRLSVGHKAALPEILLDYELLSSRWVGLISHLPHRWMRNVLAGLAANHFRERTHRKLCAYLKAIGEAA